MALNIKKLFGKKKKPEKGTKPAKQEPDQVKSDPETGHSPVSAKTQKKTKTHVAKKPSPIIYKTLKQALISEKTTDLNERGQYVFLVSKQASKYRIKQAIEDLYGVKVKKIRTINMSSKPRTWRGHQGVRHGLEHGYKKAIVSLAQGEKIEVLPR